MAKIDKSQYTKSEWKLIRAKRRREKQQLAVRSTIPVQQTIRQQIQSKDNKVAFVVGNGTSRSPVNIEDLKPHGLIYACNAVYRNHEVDYLVAVDTKMVLEINKNGYQRTHQVWTNYNKAYEKFKGFNYFQPSQGWSSGPTALHLASGHDNETVYILGFDYQGLGDKHDKVNNIFAGSPNYKKSTDKATYFGNWLRQTGIVIQKNPKKRYIRVTGGENFIPEPLAKHNNLTHITIDEFMEKFKLS